MIGMARAARSDRRPGTARADAPRCRWRRRRRGADRRHRSRSRWRALVGRMRVERRALRRRRGRCRDRKSTRLNSSHVRISYAGFCLKKKKKTKKKNNKQNRKNKKYKT